MAGLGWFFLLAFVAALAWAIYLAVTRGFEQDDHDSY